MNFSRDFPDKLRSSLLLSEVIGKKVQLKQKGKEFIGLCPFHNEKTPSFTVSNQKGLFHCFGCQASGDMVGFVMQSENLNFKEAVISIANRFGIEIPLQNPIDKVREKKQEESLEITEVICRFFEENLYSSSGKKAMQYLQNRGINLAAIKKFRLGYAPDSYEILNKYLFSKNFTDSQIADCGVIGRNDRGNFYDKFRNRVIFPISDIRGKIIAFGGRSLGDDLPKYLNSAETAIFKKSQTLFNFFNAKAAIGKKGQAIMVEGYMDVISLDNFGFENVVAGLGTAISKDHFLALFRFTEKVIICLDGDSAGIRAAKRAAEIALPLINSKRNLNFVILPLGLDPDDFLKKYGALAFEKEVSKAKSLSQFLLDNAISSVAKGQKSANSFKISAEEKAKISGNLEAICEAILDQNSRKFFAQFFKDSLYFLGRNSFRGKKTAFQNFATTDDIVSLQIDRQLNQNLPGLAQQKLNLNIVALLIYCPRLIDYFDDFFEVRNCHFFDQEADDLKDFVISEIDLALENQENGVEIFKNSEISEKLTKKILSSLQKSGFRKFFIEIEKNLIQLSKISQFNEADANLELVKEKGIESRYFWARDKLRLLLLKDLLFQVEKQYEESIVKLEIDTKSSEISDQKITEIFKHKNLLQSMILSLEQEV